ncbi:MAG: S9 family peptidase [Oscillatoriales cyanobacterium SM2_1_8]|nr:S9 family peptidase [Oscillatoriales cyanobacterium SM2_1_8]
MIGSYGTWRSPLTADAAVARTVGLSEVRLGDGVWWLEKRPAEEGRSVLVSANRVLPPPFSVRNRVNEYGGGAYLLLPDGVLFTNDADRRLYRWQWGETPMPLTVAGPHQYADGVWSEVWQQSIWVREMAEPPGQQALVAIGADGAEEVVVTGADFYAAPCWRGDGRQLAWVSWNAPAMPWDSSELWVADVEGDRGGLRLTAPRWVAGGAQEAVMQPLWAPNGDLYFVSDRAGWWNLYRWHPEHGTVAVYPITAEFGHPPWVFGQRTYGFLGQRHLLAAYGQQGRWFLGLIGLGESPSLQQFELPFTQIADVQCQGDRAVWIGSGPQTPPAIAACALPHFNWEIVQGGATEWPSPLLSQPEPIEFQGGVGPVWGFCYPPQNPEWSAATGERPPLLVRCHGGPTGARGDGFDLKVQFWTSRGFVVLDINYSGSSGYGRPYRDRLVGEWGRLDWQDCVLGAQHLIRLGRVDGDRCFITGSSAGGYTALCALAQSDVFRAGASYYGIADMESLRAQTHRFEAGYIERLVGPYTPERYRERSPLYQNLQRPVVFFQGLRDRVVPPSQTAAMVESLRQRGIPVACLTFAEEGHGFRRAETQSACLAAELAFYGRVAGFRPDFGPDGRAPDLAIANL